MVGRFREVLLYLTIDELCHELKLDALVAARPNVALSVLLQLLTMLLPVSYSLYSLTCLDRPTRVVPVHRQPTLHNGHSVLSVTAHL